MITRLLFTGMEYTDKHQLFKGEQMTTLQIMKRACRNFPRTEYTEPSAVRHARRQWKEAIEYLRNAPGGSKWILDKQVTRQ